MVFSKIILITLMVIFTLSNMLPSPLDDHVNAVKTPRWRKTEICVIAELDDCSDAVS